MMGRGSVDVPAEAALPGVDLFAQARKALSVSSPFDPEESAPRVPTLPSGLASFLLRGPDSHRKHKKSHGEAAQKPPGHGKPPTVWDVTEEFFRPVALSDIDLLAPKLPLCPGLLDSCFTMPVFDNGAEDDKKDSKSDTCAAELSSITLPNKEEVILEQQIEEVEKVQAAEELPPMEIDEVVTSVGDAVPMQAEGDDDNLSLHWLLGLKKRLVLSAERPDKKRKLLDGDAGLDRLLLLPHSHTGVNLCDFCCSIENGATKNKLLRCHCCKVVVHQKCYGVHEVPEGVWLCAWCKHLETAGIASKRDGDDLSSRPCLLCPKDGGALKTVRMDPPLSHSDGAVKFVHLFCSLWTPDVYVKDTWAMELVTNMGGIQDKRRRLVCNVCKVKHGLCIRCSHGTCRTSFHPLCARESNHQMEIWGKFGCTNVELRAFCSKHSTFQDMGGVEDTKNILLAIDDKKLVPKLSSAVLPTKKLPTLQLTPNKRDQIMMQNEIANLNSEKIVQMKPDEQDALVDRLDSDGGQAGTIAEMDTDGAVDSKNIKRSTYDVSAILRKLIDQGKINADDVASEMGISLDSLQAALIGETTSFSPGLRLKIIKWLQSSVLTPTLQPSKVRNSPVISSDYRVTKFDGLNDAKIEDPENNSGGDVTGVEVSDAVLVKLLPPRRRTKSNIMILKNNKALRLSGLASVLENGNGKIVDEIDDIQVVISEDMKGNINERICSSLLIGLSNDQKPVVMTMEDTSKAEDSVPSDPNQGQKNDRANDIEEKVSFLHYEGNQAVDTNTMTQNTMQSGYSKYYDGEVDVVLCTKSYLENGGFGSVFVVHPLIKKKLLHMQNSELLKNKPTDPFSNVDKKNYVLSTYAVKSSCSSCVQQGLLCAASYTSDDAKELDQLSKAKSVGVLDLSPEDEVEGEIIYLQARLLDNAVLIKHSCEDLLLKIVENLAHELNALNKRKWDLILVNQFLREIREAKKRGRKERKHKEAQAVLAAVSAAAAVSSRNSSSRKDSNDETVLGTQEIPIKINATTGIAGLHPPLVPRTTDAFRSTFAKLSSSKHSMAFQMPDFLKDNALSCEICMRTETILNRVFVCSRCKVAVHLDCYRRLKNPIGSWKCELCEDMSLPSTSPKSQTDGKGTSAVVAQCGLCGGVTGAFRKSADGQWVHALCAEWLLESSFRRGQENLVEGMDTISKEKDTCCICYCNVGACLKCSYGHCKVTFHPSCATSAGFYMNAKVTDDNIQHKAYCGKHSIGQREADNQQCGSEDINSLKQIRKDLVRCSHDILASRRDCAAYSVLVRSSFQSGASSESATTSINNRSYSGTIQRSDEITVDSTVSREHIIRWSLHNKNFHRNTDDSSTSQLSFKRKLADRASFAGKQLPRKLASDAFWKSADGENRPKAKKPETFQKELVMTSDQACMQNQRLPKGYFYVPVGSLSKELPLEQDLESRELQEPGG
ncbi:PHD-finger domain containing protein [Musa troglodytarum]|uniref:PHD-finger domain containing protein n=1 Tax=Musa troglodytarum TaxID=320322 RepID=A0A9E7HX84_9LILI|nr:PHD-finger domain containing protein [Musa troglodytarum]